MHHHFHLQTETSQFGNTWKCLNSSVWFTSQMKPKWDHTMLYLMFCHCSFFYLLFFCCCCYYYLLLSWFCGIFLVLNTLIPPAVLWKTLVNKMKYWLTDHIRRKETDGIRLFCQLHKWSKWNNRLLMPQVVWCWGEKKIFQTKLWLLSWWFKIGMFFYFEKIFLFQYYSRKTRKGEL